ncbi:hypothetical protein IDM40_11305 [Nocardiopsis sp. HNM0947]|uniref:Integral membrane protein n=1 Tax=Nocardiopsis coralli TaxID=2772213 RepID=A0ABR9P614_9ACTN|nr:hypothetical protein [Nocardiopsis coralli]MBE2999288.1 hypothetical protein [Nocardiopsis coralli]
MTTTEPQEPQQSKRPTVSEDTVSSVLTGATCVVLFLLGLVLGTVSTVSAGWLTRYWDGGQPAPALAIAALVVYVVLLYVLCRLAAWGGRRQSAAVAFALGYAVVLFAATSYLPGGDVLLQDDPVHYAFLIGAMVALAAAVVRSAPRRRPA